MYASLFQFYSQKEQVLRAPRLLSMLQSVHEDENEVPDNEVLRKVEIMSSTLLDACTTIVLTYKCFENNMKSVHFFFHFLDT